MSEFSLQRRYYAVHEHEVEDIIAPDIALRRNDEEWLEKLPPELEKDIVAKLYYGHFFCHAKLLKQELLRLLDKRGAEYPAKHNVGHLYDAKPRSRRFTNYSTQPIPSIPASARPSKASHTSPQWVMHGNTKSPPGNSRR